MGMVQTYKLLKLFEIVLGMTFSTLCHHNNNVCIWLPSIFLSHPYNKNYDSVIKLICGDGELSPPPPTHTQTQHNTQSAW